MAARFVHRLGDQRGQDVVEYAGVLVLVAALVAAVASLGLGAMLARAVTCEVQQIEQNSGCSAASIGGAIGGGGSVSAARSTAEAHSVGHRRHQQAVHMHTAAASTRVPTALAKLQHDAAFFRTGKGSLVALALARKIASQACDANDGDMLGPSYLCSAGQYTSNELAVYHALQNGRNIGGLSLTEPSFDTSVGFWNPVTLLTSVAAGPVGDLITNIAGTLTKDGIQQAGSAVAGLLGKQELAADASLQKTLITSGDLPAIAGGSQLEDLLASGRQLDPADAGGQLTRAGRAFAKHSGLFSPVTGGPAALNEAGQKALEDILSNPATKEGVMRQGNFAGGKIFIAPNGVGAVFDTNGVLQYFGRFTYQ